MQWIYFAVVILWTRPLLSFGGNIKIHPANSQYFGGNIIRPTFTCQPSEGCGNTIKWFFGQNQIDTSLTKYTTSVNLLNDYQTLTVNDAVVEDVGFYFCQCTFSGQAVNSPESELKHTPPVTFDTVDNIVYQGVVGSNVTLTCVILYFVEFQWQFSDKSVVPVNNGKYIYEGNNLTIMDLSVNDNMTYYCLANNQVTTVASIRSQLIVYKHPTLVADGETDITINEGDTVTLNCTADGNPRPTVSWSKSNGILKIEGRISLNEVIIDDFTRHSTLTIQYVSSSDQGTYLCTGQSSSLDKQSSVTNAFSLTVIVPPEPYFQLFTIARGRYNITIGWNLSGINSNSINVTWSLDTEPIGYTVYPSNISTVVITDLLPGSLYMITAEVIGTEYSGIVNDSTNELDIVSSSILSTPTFSSTSYIIYSNSSQPVTSVVSTSSDVTTTRETTSSQSRPSPSVAKPRAISNDVLVAAPVSLVVLIIIIIVLIVVGLVCVISIKGRSSKKRNLQSIERGNSSRSSQGLLEDTDKFINAMNSSSFVSIQSTGGYLTSPTISSNLPNVKNNFSYGNNPSESSFHPMTSNVSDQSYDIKPPAYSTGKEGLFFVGVNEPFQMTDNPGSVDFEVARSSQLAISQMTDNAFFDEQNIFPAGDSVSQVILDPRPQLMTNSSNRQYNNASNQSFECMTGNAVYETMPYKSDNKSQSEPPSYYHDSAAPIYENHTTTKPTLFGIVQNGQRGAIREQVEIKSRH